MLCQPAGARQWLLNSTGGQHNETVVVDRHRPGDPRQVTYEAVDGLRQAHVFFVLDKGSVKNELCSCARPSCSGTGPRAAIGWFRSPTRCAMGRPTRMQAVQDWHVQRAALYAQLIEQELGDGETGAFLWGEPTLYDSTLRILDLVCERVARCTCRSFRASAACRHWRRATGLRSTALANR